MDNDSRKLSGSCSNTNDTTTNYIALNDIDHSTTIMKTVEFNDSYYEPSSLRKNSKNINKLSIGISTNKDSKDENQSFPCISGETMNNYNNNNRSQNLEANNYYDTLMMENSCTVNIFSTASSNSSNIYGSNSTEISRVSQSIEIKANIEFSDIKRIIIDQIFKELNI
ncbi:hypothetical protein PIROE2DRAFT_3943 [Piromyces sp. E2]|nr:hypothetical protein PIROE2DRAFT_3943 [Piromyces sp. E2]|eukprot:OUM68346.1 hypothetical protein PIROE2DRAFT_3943 [Piromyces sp. E2]